MECKSKSRFGFKSGFEDFSQIRWIWFGFDLNGPLDPPPPHPPLQWISFCWRRWTFGTVPYAITSLIMMLLSKISNDTSSFILINMALLHDRIYEWGNLISVSFDICKLIAQVFFPGEYIAALYSRGFSQSDFLLQGKCKKKKKDPKVWHGGQKTYLIWPHLFLPHPKHQCSGCPGLHIDGILLISGIFP